MKIRCLIVDDEPLAVRLISSYVQNLQELEIVAVCNNAIDAFTVLQKHKIDLIFLDIKMPKLLGTDFLMSLSNPPKVIFITAYRDYAVEGFELEVVDYLLKPVSFNRFMKAVAKASKLLAIESENSTKISKEFSDDNKAFLYFKAGKEMVKVLVHEIDFIESKKEYVKIYFEKGTFLMVKQSISYMEKILSPHRFIRIHRSFIVTIEKILTFTHANVTVSNKKIPVGRLYKYELQKILKL
ncbi:MAG: LytTR family DNA-binding domain-containing protein [Ferruginibacter sp.]